MNPVRVVSGRVAVLDRPDVDTDQIIPKQFLKRVERTGFGEFLFYDWIRDGEIELEPNPILVTGRNFGCGSSREHAPWGLQEHGFEAIVAPSFGDIFRTNCVKIGLVPVILAQEQVKKAAEEEGLDDVFRSAGFEWREAGCSMCLGMNPDILDEGERCASTSNRNFEGRQGKGGRTHLVSPRMAAAAAVEGHFVDIREW